MLVAIPQKTAAHHQQHDSETAFPTVLVAVGDEALRQKLVRDLSQDRCLVLRAATEREAIMLIITHSRAIHVAVVGVESQALEQTFGCYRPNIHIVRVTANSTMVKEGVYLPHIGLTRVRQLLGTGGDEKSLVASA